MSDLRLTSAHASFNLLGGLVLNAAYRGAVHYHSDYTERTSTEAKFVYAAHRSRLFSLPRHYETVDQMHIFQLTLISWSAVMCFRPLF